MSEQTQTSGVDAQMKDVSGTRDEPTNTASSVAQAMSLSGPPSLSPFHCPRRLRGQKPIVSSPLIWATYEHASLGDNLCLKKPNPNASQPDQKAYIEWYTGLESNKFDFHKLDSTLNNQCLSYGQINALAGDFYATYEPISGDVGEGHPAEDEATRRFIEAWELLAVQPASVEETQKILAQDQEFEDDVLKKYENSLGNHQISWIYATKMVSAADQIEAFRTITDDREGSAYGNKTYPGYLGILLNNFDHFGHDAHFAYTTGHRKALEVAVEAGQKKNENKLMVAYAMNAFAEHFLEDAFSAGHLRTPRRHLHGISGGKYTLPDLDLCSNLMHNEDSALGIKVRNKRKDKPDTWVCVGDEYLHDKTAGAEATLRLCREALQASADEIWEAYHTGKVPKPEEYQALTIAPDLESALEEPHDGEEHLAPLYKVSDGSLKERNWSAGIPFIAPNWNLNRTNWSDDNYTDFGSLEATWYYERLSFSGWWNYPLQLHAASPDPN